MNLKNISKLRSNGKVYYVIRKTIKGVTRSFGTYKSLNEAISVRDELISNGWVGVKKKRKDAYIYPRGDGYVIVKNIKGKLYSFGTYENYDEAVIMRNYFQSTGWCYKHKYRVRCDDLKYIYPRGDKWVIIKDEDYYGGFSCLEDAQKERDSLVNCGFDVEEYCSLI